MTLANKVQEFNEQIVPIARQIVHGSDTTVVMTDGGPVRSFAKLIKDLAESTAFPAANVSFAPAGGVVAVNVQAAIAELDTKKTSTAQVNTVAAATLAAAKAYADSLSNGASVGIDDAIVDGATTRAPSQNAVYDALQLKASLDSPTFTGTVQGITKAMVGLSNVNNTADADKPVSSAAQTVFNTKADKSTTYTKLEVDAKTATTVKTGDVITTARPLSSPDWLLCDGTVYLQTAYPALHALLGAAFEPFKLSNPDTLPAGDANDLSYSGDGGYMAVAHAAVPYVTFYKRTVDAYAKLANPTSPGAEANTVACSADGIYFVAGTTTAPFLAIYKRTGDTFSKLANPAVLPTSNVNKVSLTPDGVYLAVGCQIAGGTPLILYKRTGDTFVKIADADVPPDGNVRGVAFSADGLTLACAVGTFGISVFKRTGDAFNKITSSSFIVSSAEFVAVSPNGAYFAAGGSANTLQVYKRTGDTFVKLADPAVMPVSAQSASFSADGKTIAFAHATAAPYGSLYRLESDTLARLPELKTVLPASAYGVAFSPDGRHLAFAHNQSSYVSIYGRSYDQATQFIVPTYQPGSVALKNYIKT